MSKPSPEITPQAMFDAYQGASAPRGVNAKPAGGTDRRVIDWRFAILASAALWIVIITFVVLLIGAF